MSEFWKRKMRTHYVRLDTNRNGKLDRAEFREHGPNLMKRGKINSNKAEEITKAYMSAWNGLTKEECVNFDEYMELMKNCLIHPTEIRKGFSPIYQLVFRALVSEGSITMNLEDYRLYFEILNIAPSMAQTTFEALDTDKDGLVSEKEFVDAAVEFFISEDESRPSQLFFGTLL